MKDPKSIWPFYYPAPVVRSDVLKKNPKIEKILNEVSASLDVETMRKLNAQVDLDQEDPEDVAAEYLEKRASSRIKQTQKPHDIGAAAARAPQRLFVLCRAFCASDAREGGCGEDHLHGHLEVLGDLQGEVEAGTVLAPFEVAHGLVVDT